MLTAPFPADTQQARGTETRPTTLIFQQVKCGGGHQFITSILRQGAMFSENRFLQKVMVRKNNKNETYLGVVRMNWCILVAHGKTREAARRHLLLQSIRPTWPDTSQKTITLLTSVVTQTRELAIVVNFVTRGCSIITFFRTSLSRLKQDAKVISQCFG